MNMIPVFSMHDIAARLLSAGVSLVDASNLIAYQSRGKLFVMTDGESVALRKHYQAHKGAEVVQVEATPRDLKNVCVWLNAHARGKGIDLGLSAPRGGV